MAGVPLPVVTDEAFPCGLRCTGCGRLISAGQPYAEHLEGFIGGEPLTVLYCVYC